MRLPRAHTTKSFRPWKYEPDTRVIQHTDNPYYVDLGRCRTSAEVLDWIAQISQKTWADDKCLANLVRILDHVLQLQANYCPGGVEKNQ